jgi:hypothetical protein
LCLRIGWAGYDGLAITSRFLQRGQDSVRSAARWLVRPWQRS